MCYHVMPAKATCLELHTEPFIFISATMNSLSRSLYHKTLNESSRSRIQSGVYRWYSRTKRHLAPTLYMWGTDTKGSLLKPNDRKDEDKLSVPTKVDLREHVAEKEASLAAVASGAIEKIVCGAAETAILMKNGTCLVSGQNKQGHLGLGHKNATPMLTSVHIPSAEKEGKAVVIRNVSLSSDTGAFLDDIGDLYTAGFDGSTFSGGVGALCQGETESCLIPSRVDSLVEDGCLVRDVQVGESHTTVLTTEGEVLTAGAGNYGRLGNYETIDQLFLEPVEVLTEDVVSIAGGKSFTLALTKEGIVYAWGRNHKGQLGIGLGLGVDMYSMQSVPEPIEADELFGRNVVKIAAGHSHAACITESGELFYWGMSQHLEPVRVNSLLHTKVVDVACGEDYTLAVGEDGKLYSFGEGRHGGLGQGSMRRTNDATLMESLQGKRVLQISAGWKHAACLVEE